MRLIDPMHYTQYFTYHVDLLRQFKENISQDRPYQVDIDELSDNDQQFISTLDKICAAETYSEEMSEQGQWLVGQIVNGYNHLLIAFSRDLLWFLGALACTLCPIRRSTFISNSTSCASLPRIKTSLLTWSLPNSF